MESLVAIADATQLDRKEQDLLSALTEMGSVIVPESRVIFP